MEIDPIEKGPREPVAISCARTVTAGTGMGRVAKTTTRAWVHSSDEQELGGEPALLSDPVQHNMLIFEGLAKGLKCLGLKFREFVEEKHAMVGQSDLARDDRSAAAHQAHAGDGMMGLATGSDSLGQSPQW